MTALYSFVNQVGPAIPADLMNRLDIQSNTVFGEALTKPLVRTALTSDLPLEVANGGTGSRTGPAEALNVRSAIEISLGYTPTDYNYPVGNILRYGADRTEVADSTTAIQTAINVIKAQGAGIVKIPYGRYKVTAALTYTATNLLDSIIIEGEGSGDSGSILVNDTNDVECFLFNGVVSDALKRADRIVLRDFAIVHEAATKYAMVFKDAPFLFEDNVAIELNDAGFGGMFLGTTTVIPDSANYLSHISNTDIRNYTSRGIRINSTGHTFNLFNNKVGGTTAGGVALEINTEYVHVNSGQYTNAAVGDSKAIWFNNIGAGDIEGGSVRNVKIEGIQAAQIGVDIGGTTNAFVEVLVENVGANLTSQLGTVVSFTRAKWCKYINPAIRTPTGGGTLVNFGEFSTGCELVSAYNAATAPITVHASATRAFKNVTGEIARSQVTNITTNANLRTVLSGGIDELQGFSPVHSHGNWNYWLVTIADDAASSFTLPLVSASLVRCGVRVLSDRGVTFGGYIVVDADSGGAAVSAQGVGADFNSVATSLAGTTGTDVKVTLGVHTDNKIYLENRSGASGDFTVLLQPVLFGT